MTIQQWLKDVYYDEYGQYLWSKQSSDGGSQMIAEIRGWGAIQNSFPYQEQATKFQDEVGKFIADAINEKIDKSHIVQKVVSETLEQLLLQTAAGQWVKFDFYDLSTRPTKSGKYLVCRKDGKIHWETWSTSGWAYNHNSITHWAVIKSPKQQDNGMEINN